MSTVSIHSLPADYRPLVKQAMREGWTLTAKGKHPKLTCPDGTFCTPIPRSPGNKVLVHRVKLALRRHGVDV